MSNGLLERITTGSPALDTVLDGGFPIGSTTLIAGRPGAGKTILALQLVFNAARRGVKCIYVSTLTEPSIKLLRYMQSFGFFDEKLLSDRIVLMDVGSAVREESIDKVLKRLVERVEQEGAGLVVIDSMRSLVEVVPREQRRMFLYDLSVHLATWQATTFLVGTYSREEMQAFPEFTIADGIIRLDIGMQELARVRELEVQKLRGSNPVLGLHFFDIDSSGMRFHPRVRLPAEARDRRYPATDRVTTGVDGLDALLGGGFPRASTTLVLGGAGTGKTTIALNFLVEGARSGEPGVLFTLEETPEQLRGSAVGLGWDLRELEAQRQLTISYTAPVELSTDRFLQQARETIERTGARRAALDSLTSMELGTISNRRYRELVYAFAKHMRAAGVTLVVTLEAPERLGRADITAGGLSFACDNMIFLRYVELAGHLERAIATIKGRGFRHSMELRKMTMGSGGAHVGGLLEEMQGVLTGLPTRRQGPAAEGER